MEHARPPAELTLDGGPANRAEAWRRWLKQFRVFLKASGLHKEATDVQANLLINLVGPEGYDVFSTFKFPKPEDGENLEKVIELFNNYFGTKVNTTIIRFKFFTRNQMRGESIDEYVTALKLMSQQCEFETLEDGLLRDRIVCGVYDTAVRDRLLRTDDLTLEKAVKICQANEVSCDNGRQIEGVVKNESSSSSGAVDALWRSGGPRRSAQGGAVRRDGGGSSDGVRQAQGRLQGSHGGAEDGPSASGSTAVPLGARVCAACGDLYCAGDTGCMARKVRCFLCGYRGHFKKMCQAKGSNRVYELSVTSDKYDSEQEDLYYVS